MMYTEKEDKFATIFGEKTEEVEEKPWHIF